MRTAYIDLDGVLVDLVQGVLNREHITHYHWPEGHYNIEEVLGIKLNELDADFWINLPMTNEAIEIMNLISSCKFIGNILLLTQPCNSACAAGKWTWWERSQFHGFPLIMCSNKRWFSRPDTILFDDCDINCEEFRNGGQGVAILISRPWNSQYGHDPLISLKEYLK